jgi:hypothetical protein
MINLCDKCKTPCEDKGKVKFLESTEDGKLNDVEADVMIEECSLFSN